MTSPALPDGSQLAAMAIDNGTTVKTMKFYYDAAGIPVCLDYNGTMYFYITNLQGDVVALADQYGEVIRYEYDAWGKPLVSEYYFSSHSDAMQNNPLRYRGYIYDSETGFYYLQSRYYDPAVGRFINVDGVGYLGATGTFLSFNLFAYCENNPVMCLDPNGHVVISTSAIITTLIIGAIIGGGIAAGATAYEDYSDDGEVFNGSVGLDEYAGNTLGGVIAGAGTAVCSVLGAGLGVALVAGETALTIGGCAISGAIAFGIGVGSSFVAGGLGYTARTAVNQKESFEFSDMLIESGANAVTGALTFAGATVGGICGVQIPGESSNFGNLSKYHIGLAWFGVYPTKILISCIKGKLKEDY